jgi:uracil phosphoribosyltransferase
MPISVCQHPLAQHLLTRLRDEQTPPEHYRRAARNLTTVLALAATEEYPVQNEMVTTPLTQTMGQSLAGGLAVIPILRAGLGMLEPVLELFPDVAVGYIGLERSEETAEARRYYAKLPKLNGRFTLCLDPMLATGGSAAQAVHMLKAQGAGPIRMVCVIAAPEGIAHFEQEHPDVPIITAAVDECLYANKYIVPGLGDFGDRLFGTF